MSVMLKVAAIAGSFALAVVAPQARALQGTVSPPAVGACSAAGSMKFICGLKNVEDLIPVSGGRWLVGSSYLQGSAGLYVIDTAAKSAREVRFSTAKRLDPRYSACAPPDYSRLLTHGLDVVELGNDTVTVYAVNHGSRESVEVFHLWPASARAEWVGCVVLPENAIGNAVAVLPDGGFVVSKFLDKRDAHGIEHVMAGRVNGTVYRWRIGAGFEEVAGTRLSGDNGVAITHDGRWLFVNAYGSHEVVRVALAGAGAPQAVKVDFNPDNLRWAPDGELFVTGQFRKLGPPTGHDGWETVVLDPNSLHIAPLLREPGRAEFDDGTSTVQVGPWLWIGTFLGDRVAYLPRP